MIKIQDIIERHVNLNYANRGGWHYVQCPVCNDYKVRAGFKFDNDGESVVYHCFNESTCGGAYNPPDTAGFMSSNMIKVLEKFGIPKNEYQELIFQNTILRTQFSTETKQVERITPDYIEMPQEFENIRTSSSIIAELACEYIKERGIPLDRYEFFVLPYESDEKHLCKWNCRLILPAYRNNKLIYFQGRNMLDDNRKRYESCTVPAEKVFYNFDELFKNTATPLLIFEGLFDGLSISTDNFISIMSSNLTIGQQTLLKNSRRDKIIVPDQKGNGWELAKQGIELGFGVSFPNLQGFKDINEACGKLGRVNVLYEILTNIKYGYEAEMFMNMKKVGL